MSEAGVSESDLCRPNKRGARRERPIQAKPENADAEVVAKLSQHPSPEPTRAAAPAFRTNRRVGGRR